MAQRLPIDYVTKDYEGFLQMMKDAIPTLAPEWTNTTDSDMGIVILQQLAYGLHVLGYYEDKGTNEAFLPTARTRKAIMMLARFLGYEPYKQTAAVVPIRFTKDAAKLNTDVTVPKGTKISTNPKLGNVVIFETDTELLIPAGTLSAVVNATQGQSVKGEVLGTSDGSQDQMYFLTFPSVLEKTIVLKTTENGASYNWKRVDQFVDSLPSDRHYTTTVMDDGTTRLNFGNGVTGMKVPYQAVVSADYRYGGGRVGNVGANKINYIVDTNVSGIASVINEVSAQGGEDAEPLERIRVMAPKYYRAGGRAVTASDFEDLAEMVAGIHKARCIETFNANMDVELYLATESGEAPSTALKDLVRETIESVMIMNQNLVILDATYIDYAVSVDVYVREGTVRDEMYRNLLNLLNDQLKPSNFTFGDDVYKAFINNMIFASSAQITNVVVNDPTADVICAEGEIPRLTGVTVNIIGGV